MITYKLNNLETVQPTLNFWWAQLVHRSFTTMLREQQRTSRSLLYSNFMMKQDVEMQAVPFSKWVEPQALQHATQQLPSQLELIQKYNYPWWQQLRITTPIISLGPRLKLSLRLNSIRIFLMDTSTSLQLHPMARLLYWPPISLFVCTAALLLHSLPQPSLPCISTSMR